MRVEVGRKRREPGTAERAPAVPKEERREVWAGWLAERRYRSLRALAEAVGFSAGFVGRVLRGERCVEGHAVVP